jgi:hypothetical protein
MELKSGPAPKSCISAFQLSAFSFQPSEFDLFFAHLQPEFSLMPVVFQTRFALLWFIGLDISQPISHTRERSSASFPHRWKTSLKK